MFRMPVSLYATPQVIAVQDDTLLTAVQDRLALHRISALPVLNVDGRAIGVISRTDLFRVGTLGMDGGRPVLRLPEAQVRDVMSLRAFVVSPSTSVGEAARHMLDQHIHRVFVESSGRLEGVLSTKDVMRAIFQKRLEVPIESLMTAPVHTIDGTTPLGRATEALKSRELSGLVVLEGMEPIGVFTTVEAIESRAVDPKTPVEEVMGYSLLTLPTKTPIYRAAGYALAMRSRRVLAMEGDMCRGILTGVNLAGAAALH